VLPPCSFRPFSTGDSPYQAPLYLPQLLPGLPSTASSLASRAERTPADFFPGYLTSFSYTRLGGLSIFLLSETRRPIFLFSGPLPSGSRAFFYNVNSVLAPFFFCPPLGKFFPKPCGSFQFFSSFEFKISPSRRGSRGVSSSSIIKIPPSSNLLFSFPLPLRDFFLLLARTFFLADLHLLIADLLPATLGAYSSPILIRPIVSFCPSRILGHKLWAWSPFTLLRAPTSQSPPLQRYPYHCPALFRYPRA